jgi:hypothetical protein
VKILLHIGTDKTGSTAIQRALWENRDWLLERGVYVPETGLGVDNGHAQLLQALDESALAGLARELASVDTTRYTTVLLSWEGMCKFNRAQIKALYAALPEAAVEVLVYLRDQAEIVQSAHLQWVQMNPDAIPVKSLSVPKSLPHRLRQSLFLRHPQRNYFKLLKRWQSAAPGVTFCLRRFAPEHLEGGDILVDFLARLGLAPDAGFIRQRGPTNPSIDVETALLLEQWRKDGLSAQEIATRFDLAVAIADDEGTGNRWFLDKDAVDATRRHFRASNARAAALAGCDSGFIIESDSRCWRTEPFSSAYNRSRTRDQKITEENAIPTLHEAASGAALGDHLLLHSGWSGVESWGVWSDAQQSIVQFRIPKQVNSSDDDIVELGLIGKYYGPNHKTQVKANNLELGWRDLSAIDGKLQIPVSELGPMQRITLELTHEQPTRPADVEGGEDQRDLAFALCSLSWQVTGPQH